jgi:hypothetical protein
MQKDFLVSRPQNSGAFLIVVQDREVVRQLQVKPISVLEQLGTRINAGAKIDRIASRERGDAVYFRSGVYIDRERILGR